MSSFPQNIQYNSIILNRKIQSIRYLEEYFVRNRNLLDNWQKIFLAKLDAADFLNIPWEDLSQEYSEIVRYQKIFYGVYQEKIQTFVQIKEIMAESCESIRMSIKEMKRVKEKQAEEKEKEELIRNISQKKSLKEKRRKNQIVYQNDEDYSFGNDRKMKSKNRKKNQNSKSKNRSSKQQKQEKSLSTRRKKASENFIITLPTLSTQQYIIID